MTCTPRTHTRRSRRIQTLLLSGLVLLSALRAVSQAAVTSAITSDGTLGTTVTQAGKTYTISGGTLRSSNLFQSFDRFSVGTSDTATFTGPAGTVNILSRVTGGQPSSIDGVLRSEITGANLYLLNPSGVMFGPNASLDVSGSFHVSTADVLRFADGATFSATLGQASVLTVAPPAAFGFLGSHPAGITIQGSSLKVSEGKALSVVGGDMTILGTNAPLTAEGSPTLGAPGGRIQLASVAAPGDVRFSPLELAPDVQVDSFARLGRLALAQNAFVDASGNGGGTVLLRSGRLRVDSAWMFADNLGHVDGTGLGVDLRVAADAVVANSAFITTDSLGAGRARDLRLTAGSLHLDDALIGSRPFASGDGGNVGVNVGTLRLTGGAQISTSTPSSGRGGTLTVAASEAIVIAGRNSQGMRSGLRSQSLSSGDAGRLFVSTPFLTMDGGLIEAGAESSGRAGDLELRGGRFTLTGGARIDSSTDSAGRGGDLTVVASDAIVIAGRDSEGNASGLFSSTEGFGDAGRLFVSAPLLSMDGGRIQTNTLGLGDAGSVDVRVGRLTLTGGAQIFSGVGRVAFFIIGDPPPPGRGGDLTVVASDAIVIAGRDQAGNASGLFSSTLGLGPGGALHVAAPHLQLSDGGTISGRSSREGDAGNILLEVGTLTLTGGAQISTSTFGSGHGGTLTVLATDSLSIAGRNSGLFSNSEGLGDAGRLFISAPLLSMDGGRIAASTLGGGDAGSVDVRVGRLTLTGGAQIFSGVGEVGFVIIVPPDGDPIDSSTGGLGRGGDLTVVASDAIAIAGRDSQGNASGLFSSTTGRGLGGNLQVVAPHLQLSDGGTISASSTGAGDAGTIRLQVGETFLSQNGRVTTETERAGGGAIALSAGRLVQLIDSELTTSVRGGGGDAGNISLDIPFVVLDGSRIIANAFEGMGGNIRIGADVFLADPASRVSASSALGIAGTVDIRAPVTSLSGVLAPLPAAFVSAAELLPARCVARAPGGKASSLVLSGREGLPFDPGDLLPSPLTLDERLMADPTLTGEPHRQKVPARLAFLAGKDKVLARLRGQPAVLSQAAGSWGCPK